MIEKLKDILTVLSLTIGVGSAIAAFAVEAGTMFATFPLQATLLCLASFALGFFVCRVIHIRNANDYDKRMFELIQSLTPQQRGIVYQTYKDGEYHENVLEDRVQTLLNMGVLKCPTNVSMISETTLMLNPKLKLFLDKNADKITWEEMTDEQTK